MTQSKVLLTWITLIVLLGVFIAIPRPKGADEVIVWVNPSETPAGVGEVFNVSVQADNIPSTGAMGFQMVLRWDPTVLVGLNSTEVLFHSVTPESEWDNIWRLEDRINNTFGYAYYAYTFQDSDRAISGGYAPITGNHTLFTVTFQGASTGLTVLNVWKNEIGDAMGNPIPRISVDGTVTVGNPPPTIAVISPENLTYYNTDSLNLTFTLSKPVAWIGYSLDGHPNITIIANTTIQALDGEHDLVVYANDTAGRMGSSAKVYFGVDTTPPTAAFSYSPSPPEPEPYHGSNRWTLAFNASASYDAITDVSAYYWDFDDGANATGVTVSHIYRQPGSYDVKLTVNDALGNSATQVKTVTINPASSLPLSISYGLVLVIVIPAVWVPALWYYFTRTRRTRKRV